MIEFGLVGEHLGHSFSPEIHSRIGEYRYELIELSPAELGDFILSRRFRGLNVTIPYKQAVIPFLDELSPQASVACAVNTIVVRDGKLIGCNTDCYGFESMLSVSGVCLRGRSVLILGAGGAAHAVRAVAEYHGASRIANAVRHYSNPAAVSSSAEYWDAGSESIEEILYSDLCDEWDVIVNATPCGMYPEDDSCPIDLSDFGRVEAVLDCIYNPLKTNLILDAKSRGVTVIGGLHMLVAQAFRSADLFGVLNSSPVPGLSETGALSSKALGQSAMTRIASLTRSLEFEKSNLVLIGMPSCGKTTVGRELSSSLGRTFIDCDARVVERVGMSIPEIFATSGEAAFRAVEREVISELSHMRGTVISTGGGAVLDSENVRKLKRNGILIYLDTLLDNLSTGHGRPLSSDRDTIARMYEQRTPLYRTAADIIVDNNCQSSVAVSRITGFLF